MGKIYSFLPMERLEIEKMSVEDLALTPPQKILLATDLSSRGDRALDRAAQLARQWDAELIVVHALEPQTTSSPWPDVDGIPSWRRPPDPRAAIERQIRHSQSATWTATKGPESNALLAPELDAIRNN